jgi:hypothetical protein
MNPAGSAMNFPLTFSTAVGIDRNGFEEWDAKKIRSCGRRRPYPPNEDIHFPEPLIRGGG